MGKLGDFGRSLAAGERGTVILGSTLLGLGLLAAGLAVGDGLVRMKRADREVTVRGVATRGVTANRASWHASWSARAYDLPSALAAVDRSATTIGGYLREHGFTGADVAPGSADVSVEDERIDGKPTGRQEYTVRRRIAFSTGNVAGVQKLQAGKDKLAQQGLVLDDVGAAYEYTQLDTIKPAMIADATRDARRAAEKFADDSGSSVGGIKSATQGYFSVSSADASGGGGGEEGEGGNGGGGGGRTAASPQQSVRVVTTIDYYLN